MVKYIATALALKAFSSGPFARRIYRGLGNRFGDRRRSAGTMPRYYVDRVDRMLRLIRRHDMVRDGDRVLELGTGWLHWEALTLRLFFDIEAVLFDVWDNRQLGGLKNYVRQLSPLLGQLEGLSPAQLQRARGLIDEVSAVRSFEELYARLGFTYVVDPSGRLESLPSESIKLVVSAGVLEHVYEAVIEGLLADTRRVLRRDGWALHSIDTSDHLSHYDTRASAKQYLTLSERAWRHVFDNRVQHINRIQRGEWLELFRRSRFELVDDESKRVDISRLTPAPRFAAVDRQDLECTVIRLAFRCM